MKMGVFLSVILWAWVLTVGAKNIEPRFDGKKITNDVFWNTAEGMPLYSQGGGIFRYPDPDTGRLRYYWYGVRYAEAVRYREDPSVTYPACTFEAVTCYSSDDLINWYYEGDVLTREEVDCYGRAGWVGSLISKRGTNMCWWYNMITGFCLPCPIHRTVALLGIGALRWRR